MLSLTCWASWCTYYDWFHSTARFNSDQQPSWCIKIVTCSVWLFFLYVHLYMLVVYVHICIEAAALTITGQNGRSRKWQSERGGAQTSWCSFLSVSIESRSPSAGGSVARGVSSDAAPPRRLEVCSPLPLSLGTSRTRGIGVNDDWESSPLPLRFVWELVEREGL